MHKLENCDSLEIISKNPGDTRTLGVSIGAQATPGYVILLVGELGTGKTCLTQGILNGLGSTEYAHSPTFVIMTQYEARLTLYHVDLYRLQGIEEINELGLDEYLYNDGMMVIEWAEKGLAIYPDNHLLIEFQYMEHDQRRILITANGENYRNALCGINLSVGLRDQT